MIRYEITDPMGVYGTVSYEREADADRYKEKWEKETGRLFRKAKVFDTPSKPILVSDEYISIMLNYHVGDHIVCAHGIFQADPITGERSIIKEFIILPSGRIQIIRREKFNGT